MQLINSIRFFICGSLLLITEASIAQQSLPTVPSEPQDNVPLISSIPVFELTGFVFDGNTIFTDDELSAIAQPFVNRAVRGSDIEELRVQLTRLYIDNGYLNSGAVIRDRTISDGRITFQIIEGELSEIRIDGTGRLRPDYVLKRLRLGIDKPLNSANLQDRFQLLLNDPLIERADASLSPGTEPGQSELDLKITRAQPYELALIADNYGSPSVGAERLKLAGVVRNITGFGDELKLVATANETLINFDANFSIPINAHDTRLRLHIADSDSTVVEEPLDDIDIESRSQTIELDISHPVRRSLSGSLTLGTTLSVRKNDNTLLGIPFSFSEGEEDGNSQVSAVRLWQDYVARKADQVFALRTTLSVGIDAFGATSHSDDRPDSEFVTLLGQAQYARRVLDDRGQWVFRLDAQFSDSELLPLERISVGGAGSVRGYRHNQLVRDQAVIASAEFRYTVIQSADWGLWQVAPFMDSGYAANQGDTKDSDSLLSVGVGLLWALDSKYSAELYVGHGIDQVPAAGEHNLQDDGIHFRVRAQLY